MWFKIRELEAAVSHLPPWAQLIDQEPTTDQKTDSFRLSSPL